MSHETLSDRGDELRKNLLLLIKKTLEDSDQVLPLSVDTLVILDCFIPVLLQIFC